MPVTIIGNPVNIFENKIIKDLTFVIGIALKRLDSMNVLIDCKKCKSRMPYKHTMKYCGNCGADIAEHIGEDLSKVIYQIYNKDLSLKQYFKDIYSNELKIEHVKAFKVLTKKYHTRLMRALKMVNINAPSKFFIEKDEYWVRVWPFSAKKNRLDVIQKLKKRMYLNVNPMHFDRVIFSLVRGIVSKNGILNRSSDEIMFKFTSPFKKNLDEELIRAEKIVIYYGADARIHGALMDWAFPLSNFLKPHVPLFTTKLIDGVSVSYEPLQEHHDYHVAHTLGKGKASFGSFISLTLARYLHGWMNKHKKIPNNAEILQIAKDIYYHKIKVLHKFPGM